MVHTAGASEDAGAVYRRYADDLTRFATGIVGPWDAADVVSEAMIRCLGSGGVERAEDVRAYLYRAVLNQARQWMRSSSRRGGRERAAAARDHGEVVSNVELRPEVWAAVSALSVRQRAVIVLVYWEDLTPAQAAQRLGLSEGSVKRHLARAREHLRRSLSDG